VHRAMRVSLCILPALVSSEQEQGGLEQIVAFVNAQQTSWVAAAPAKFRSLEDVKPYLGAFLPGDSRYSAPPVKEVRFILFFLVFFSISFNISNALHLLLTAEMLWITLYLIVLSLGFLTDNINLLSLTFFFLVLSAVEFGIGLVIILLQNVFLRSSQLNDGSKN